MLRTQRKFKTVNDIVEWVKSNRDNISILKVERKYWHSGTGDLLATWRTVYYKTFETNSTWEWDTYKKEQIMIIGKVKFWRGYDKWAQCHKQSAGCEISMQANMKKHLSDKVIIEMLNSINVS